MLTESQLQACEKPCDRPDETFAIRACPADFRPLDQKFAHALCTLVKSSSNASLRYLVDRMDAEAHRCHTIVSGRRVYYGVLNHLQVNNGRALQDALDDSASVVIICFLPGRQIDFPFIALKLSTRLSH